MLASYLLFVSEDDDEAELAFSLLMLGQVFLIYKVKSLNRRRHRGPYVKNRTQAGCDRIMQEESERIFKSWFRYVVSHVFYHFSSLTQSRVESIVHRLTTYST